MSNRRRKKHEKVLETGNSDCDPDLLRCGNGKLRFGLVKQIREPYHRRCGCDTVQVLVNGKYYLTHYTNVVLIADPDQGALAYGDVGVWHGIDE